MKFALAALLLLPVAQDVDARLKEARKRLEAGLWAEAIQAYTKILDEHPDATGAYLGRGLARLRTRDIQGAIDDATASIEAKVSIAEACALRAEARSRWSHHREAIRDATRSLNLKPDQFEMHLIRATARYGEHQAEEALPDVEKLLALAPQDLRGPTLLGLCQQLKGDFIAAVEAFTKALALDPDRPLLLVRRASARYQAGDVDGALADVDRALERNPGFHEAHYHRALCLMVKARWKEAEAAGAAALLRAPEKGELRDDAKALVAALPEIAGGDPTRPLALRLLDAGKRRPSAALLEEALRLDAQLPEAHEILASLYFETAKTDNDARAKCHAHLAAILAPNQPLTPRVERVLKGISSLVLGGLLWLDAHQMPDGRWSAAAFPDACRKDGRPACTAKGTVSDVRATALTLVAHIGGGYSPLSQDYYGAKSMGRICQDGLEWLLKQQQPDGGFGAELPIIDHALATLTLSEMFGMTAREPYKPPAQKAIDRLQALRLPGKGWPARAGEEKPDALTTGWALIALKSAKISELSYSADAVKEAIDAMMADEAQRTIAAAVSIYHLRREHRAAAEPVMKSVSERPFEITPETQDANLGFFQTIVVRLGPRGETWNRWAATSRSALAKTQHWEDRGAACPDGSWDPFGPANEPLGRLVTTALHLLAAEIQWGYANSLCGPPDKD